MAVYTLQEMLSLWRRRAGLEVKRSDVTVTRADAAGSDEFFTAEIDAWYHRLLRQAPEECLVLKTPLLLNSAYTSSTVGVAMVALPASVVRPVHVKLKGWTCEARIVPPEEAGHLAALQLDPYTRARHDSPLAIRLPGGALMLSPAEPSFTSAQVERLECVVATPSAYEFHPCALAWEK